MGHRSSNSVKSPQVLIVGAGPTGLCLACGLARHGVDFRLIDKKEELSTLVKASVVTPRSLEILEDFGLADRALELGVAVHSFKMYAHDKIVWQALYSDVDSPYKFQLHLGQPYTERLLFDDLERNGGAVEWGVTLLSVEDRGDQVMAHLRHRDGREETVSMPYLAACDGAASTVRGQIGQEFSGHTYAADNLIGNVKLEWDRPPDEVHVFLSKEGQMTVGPLPDGYHQIGGGFPLDEGQPSRKGETGTLEELQTMFDRRSAIPGKIVDAERIIYYWSHHRGVERQKVGRIFLLGDAARAVSPHTGLGMNTGLQDAYNLAWKLGLVLSGAAEPAFLDSFQDERNGLFKSLGRLSDMEEIIYLLRNPVAKELRNHLFTALIGLKPVFEIQNKAIAQTDVTYRTSPVVAQDLDFPLHWPGKSHLGEHGSCPQTWFNFAEGPHAGDHASDVRPLSDGQDDRNRLYDYLDPTKHTVLCFLACREPGEALRRCLDEIVEGITETYADWIDLVLIVPGDHPAPALDWPGRVIFDTAMTAHRRYGAQGECLYLLRPDKFIAYRCLPPDWGKLSSYLAGTVFTGQRPAA